MMDHLKVMVKTMWPKRKSRHQRGKSNKPLIEKNKDDTQDGHGYENPIANNAFNTAQVRFQELHQTCDNGCAAQPTSEQQNSKQDISRIVTESFPEPPAELDQNLKKHLLDVKTALLDKLERIDLVLCEKMKECLVKCCHRQMIAHLDDLLQNIGSSMSCLLLMNWASQMSQEMPGNPNQQLLDDWEAEATVKLFESLENNISESLHKTLQIHRSQKCHDVETYVGLYVDAIQCVDSKLQGVRQINSALYDQVKEICFIELLEFVKMYAAEQHELLNNELQTWKERREKMETILFLKTLKTCKEFKNYVQLKGDNVQLSVLKETAAVLENLETLTLDLLKEIVADIAERDVKKYFKSGNGYNLHLDTVSMYFPKLSYSLDEQKIVMNEAYKIFAHTYLKHLIKKDQHKLRLWMSNVGTKVQSDARYLHNTFSDLAPGVQPWNLMLLKIPEVLDSNDIEGLKLTVAKLQMDCVESSVWSDNLQVLPALLRWKGLSKQRVKEVLEALPGGPPPDDCATVKLRTSSGSPFLRLICCS